MKIEELSQKNVSDYLDYLRLSLSQEPDMMTTDCIDEKAIVDAISKNSDGVCKSLLAYEDNKVVGRLEYHFYLCIQDIYKMAYVNWVYVLPEYRHRGIAQNMFKSFEKICSENKVNEYFLIRVDNKEAIKFYNSFDDAETANALVQRKTIR